MQYLLNDKILTESGGYLDTLLHSSEFNRKLNNPQQATIALHEHDNDLWDTYELRNFKDKSYNNILAYYVGKHKAESITKKLKSFLFMYYNTPVFNPVIHTFYCYKLLINTSSKNFYYVGNNIETKKLLDVNGTKATLSINNGITQLIKVLTKCDSLTNIATFNTITKFYKLIHTHGLVTSNTNSVASIIRTESEWSNYLSDVLGYTVNVSLKPLHVTPYSNSAQVSFNASNASNPSDYEPVKQWLIYVFKSYKLAYINNQHDLDKWNNLTADERCNYVFGNRNSDRKYAPKWINTTRKEYCKNPLRNKPNQPDKILKRVHYGYMREYIGIRTSYTYSFNRAINDICKYSATVYRLSYIRFELALYNVVQPVSLLDSAKVDDNSNTDYYRYNNRAKIGGTSKHYGWLDFYQKELNNENRNVSGNNNAQSEQLTLISSRFIIPIKISDTSVRNKFMDNHKENPTPVVFYRENDYPVPRVIPLKVLVRNSIKIENKKLELFNSS